VWDGNRGGKGGGVAGMNQLGVVRHVVPGLQHRTLEVGYYFPIFWEDFIIMLCVVKSRRGGELRCKRRHRLYTSIFEKGRDVTEAGEESATYS